MCEVEVEFATSITQKRASLQGVDTLTLDIPLRDDGIVPFLRELNKTIVDAKGRVYLAKDAVLEKEDFAAMYPKLEQFKRIKRLYDPEHRFRSRQSDRLGIT